MYSSHKLRSIDFYNPTVQESAEEEDEDDMIIEVEDNSNGGGDAGVGVGEDHGVRVPKKRAETWIQEEIRSLICFRKESDRHFNTSKSNKHLWEQISMKMREKGFDRSPSMCTDKWRNLLKEFKKVRHHRERGRSGGGLGKMSYYKELEELLRNRSCKRPSVQKQDSYIPFSDKGLDDANIPFRSVEGERRLDHDSDPLAITSADAVAAGGLPPWNWRETPENGPENHSCSGRVISIKFREYTKRIGIDATPDAIKDSIKSAFGIRTKRAFWLEDETGVIRSLDREMPLGNYTLHLDEGVTIKVCLYDDSDRITLRTEEKTLYTENDFNDFLNRHGFTGLRELSGYRVIINLDDLQSGALYQGVRLLGDMFPENR